MTSARREWWATFVVGAAVITVWGMTLGPMGSPDEPAHLSKAAAVARGQLQTHSTLEPGVFGQRVPNTPLRLPQAYADVGPQRCWLNRGDLPTACAPSLPSDEGPVTDAATYVGAYQPTYYLMVGWATVVLSPDRAVPAMRIISGFVAAGLIASAAASLRTAGAGKATAAGLVAGMTPVALLLAGTINPNGLEIAAAVGVWAGGLALVDGPDPPPARLLVRLVVAAGLLAAVRPLAPGFLIVIVGTVAVHAADRDGVRRLASDRRVVAVAAIVAAITAVSGLFVLANGSATSVIEVAVEPRSGSDLLREGAGRTGQHLEETVGVLGAFSLSEVRLPGPLWQGWLLASATIVAGALAITSWRRRAAILALLCGTLAMPVIAHVSQPEVEWQGRYALPLLVGLPLLAGWEVDRSRWAVARLVGWAAVAIAATLATIGFLALQLLLSRNVAGQDQGFFAWVHPGPWDGPLSPWTLTVLSALGALGIVALVTRSRRPPVPTSV